MTSKTKEMNLPIVTNKPNVNNYQKVTKWPNVTTKYRTKEEWRNLNTKAGWWWQILLLLVRPLRRNTALLTEILRIQWWAAEDSACFNDGTWCCSTAWRCDAVVGQFTWFYNLLSFKERRTIKYLDSQLLISCLQNSNYRECLKLENCSDFLSETAKKLCLFLNDMVQIKNLDPQLLIRCLQNSNYRECLKLEKCSGFYRKLPKKLFLWRRHFVEILKKRLETQDNYSVIVRE